jgi:hypothetical protein
LMVKHQPFLLLNWCNKFPSNYDQTDKVWYDYRVNFWG